MTSVRRTRSGYNVAQPYSVWQYYELVNVQRPSIRSPFPAARRRSLEIAHIPVGSG